MKKAIILLGLLLLLIVGCTQEKMEGGPCSYQTYDAIATITAVNGSEVTFTIEMVDEVTEEWHISWLDSYGDNEFTETIDFELEVGKRKWLEVDLITEGTCSPWIFDLDVNDKWVDDTDPPPQ
ncbi:hypothetical protein HOD38_03290 [archaeon]|jgi:hypothetical protein|nr:hypothetical protein [archaeon]MBT4397264.1 hypothetical protein [archaeon]MBT4440644.1 hypothetical protein [archaeon]